MPESLEVRGMQTLIIGDIHGCFAEFMELIEKAGLSTGDQIVAVGDIVDRGPDSLQVLDFFRDQPHAHALMGNHELKHLRSLQGTVQPAVSQRITQEQLGESYRGYVEFMGSFPLYLDLPEVLVVHGYFEPGVTIAQQQEKVLAGTLTGGRYLEEHYDRPWYELYDGEKPVVVGHQNYHGDDQPLVYGDRVYGLDTECCRGKRLTGLLLPSFRILSVPARANHWGDIRQKFAHIKSRETIPPLSWDTAAELRHRSGAADPRPWEVGLLSLCDTAEQTLDRVHDLVLAKHNNVMDELRRDPTYDQWTARQQVERYAAHLGRFPLAGLVHRARCGELARDFLKTYFKSPTHLLERLRDGKLGLPVTDPMDSTQQEEEEA